MADLERLALLVLKAIRATLVPVVLLELTVPLVPMAQLVLLVRPALLVLLELTVPLVPPVQPVLMAKTVVAPWVSSL